MSVLLISNYALANSPTEESYQSYNDIVSDLHGELRTKTPTATEKLKNSSYSLAAGVLGQMHKINDNSTNIVGLGAELGVYNFLIVPIKFKLEYASGKDLKNLMLKAKTDYSVYRYNLIDIKVGIAAGVGSYTFSNSDFTSIFITPSVAGFYQVNKLFDVGLNIDYSFHGSNQVSGHLSPSVNVVTYF